MYRRGFQSLFHCSVLDFLFIEYSFHLKLLIFDVVTSEYSMANGMRQMFDPFERVARAHHYCPCCERPFSPEEENEFVRKVNVTYFLVNL